MGTTTIHSPTGHGAHAGPPGSEPHQIINSLRGALAEQGDWQHAAEVAQAEAMAVRNRMREVEAQRDAALREGRGLARALYGIQAHVDETNAENRRLRELRADDAARLGELEARLAAAEAELARRGRRGWWSR